MTPESMERMPSPVTITVESRLLGENAQLAAANRKDFARRGVYVLNLVSSPGSGKTTLLVETITILQGELCCAVIEGDQQTDHDARRISETGARVVQINTGQACHLEASLVAGALQRLDLDGVDVLFIENVGNLICPAEYDLGEDAKTVLMSITEGEEKPLKYPLIFHLAQAVILTKTDLLPALRFNMQTCLENIRRVNPHAPILHTSAYQPETMETWISWLKAQVLQKKLNHITAKE